MLITKHVKESSLIMIMIFIMVALFAPSTQAASSYTYAKQTANNKTVLHVISTDPSNIQFKLLNEKSTLEKSGYYGINGGFFNMGRNDGTLHIAVMNDKTVTGKGQWESNSGGYNAINKSKNKEAGTIVWDGKKNELSLQLVHGMGDIKVSERKNYWAQGGISMSLDDDKNWVAIADAQGLAGRILERERTAMLFKGKTVYLIVTNNKITASVFRDAIKEKYGDKVKAIFLDGSYSSQLKCKEVSVEGKEERRLQQIITLK
ncbi:hypothetical protein [Paenibacillus sp. UMB4589-SE434]|uniref:hypothetical protein n=1 Tax=Paenibacillus sp. UMB4589-SE434 TaxID=3046314 RepID=UPI00255077B1|nr:hypothetical protein [Paenibacillus sp. UMB4589-SE434]MDK8179761.1 hypothetical protein [Paenibacillus sp. UMB4589-SE434]